MQAWVQHTLITDDITAEGLAFRSPADAGKTRRYYLAANTVVWDYVPLGINACQGRDLSPEETLYARGGNSSTYLKAQFQAYSDASFSERLVSDQSSCPLSVVW